MPPKYQGMRNARVAGVALAAVLVAGAPAVAAPRASFALGPATARAPDISGTTIVWQDDRGGSWDIYARDLTSGAETLVAGGPGDQMAPAIDGTRVVWQDDAGGTWDVRMRDLSTGVTTTISAAAHDQVAPDIDDDIVVWQDDRSVVSWDIYSRDISTGMLVPVMTHPADQLDPSIAGATIAWVDMRRGNPDVHVKDLVQGCEEAIATGPAAERAPVVTRTRIVWEDEGAGAAAIWFQDFRVVEGTYELLTRGLVSPSTAEQRAPAIAGNRIAWTDLRGGVPRARLRDTATDIELDLDPVSSAQRAVAIDGVRVAWEDSRPGSSVRWTEIGAPAVRFVRPLRGALYVHDTEIATPPLAPSEPAVAAGVILTLRAQVSDAESAVAAVRFDANGEDLCGELGPPYSCWWPLAPGTYTLGVTAFDAAGNAARVTTDVIVV